VVDAGWDDRSARVADVREVAHELAPFDELRRRAFRLGVTAVDLTPNASRPEPPGPSTAHLLARSVLRMVGQPG
jgi:hypothetical protein